MEFLLNYYFDFGLMADELEPVRAQYAARFRVYSPDRRGHGRTPDVEELGRVRARTLVVWYRPTCSSARVRSRRSSRFGTETCPPTTSPCSHSRTRTSRSGSGKGSGSSSGLRTTPNTAVFAPTPIASAPPLPPSPVTVTRIGTRSRAISRRL